jgi:hypothetical protein
MSRPIAPFAAAAGPMSITLQLALTGLDADGTDWSIGVSDAILSMGMFMDITSPNATPWDPSNVTMQVGDYTGATNSAVFDFEDDGFHTLKLEWDGTNINGYFDGVLITSVVPNVFDPSLIERFDFNDNEESPIGGRWQSQSVTPSRP